MPFVYLVAASGVWPQRQHIRLGIGADCAGALLTKPMVKPLLTRFGYRRILIWNTRLIGLMIMALSLPNADTPLWLLIPLLFALGMCNSLQYSTMNTLTLSDLRILSSQQR